MGMFEALKPDVIVKSLCSSIGVTPEHIQNILNGIVQRAQVWDAEIAAFKTGSRAAMAHFDERLDRIEEEQKKILEMLRYNIVTLTSKEKDIS